MSRRNHVRGKIQAVLSGMDGGGRRPLISCIKKFRYERFMYIFDLADVWRPLTSYGVRSLLFLKTRPTHLKTILYCMMHK